jgi:hypothetical protein
MHRHKTRETQEIYGCAGPRIHVCAECMCCAVLFVHEKYWPLYLGQVRKELACEIGALPDCGCAGPWWVVRVRGDECLGEALRDVEEGDER